MNEIEESHFSEYVLLSRRVHYYVSIIKRLQIGRLSGGMGEDKHIAFTPGV